MIKLLLKILIITTNGTVQDGSLALTHKSVWSAAMVNEEEDEYMDLHCNKVLQYVLSKKSVVV